MAAGVFAAGGEPVVVHPYAPQGLVTDAEVADRLAFADGVLLPGGGDLAAQWYGESADASAYDVDLEQDAFDLAVARVALAQAIPLLSICRGTQVVNVAHGGSLVQNLSDGTHWGTTRQLEATQLTELLGARPVVSCYHHQGIDRLADRLQVAALADDGVIEAVLLRRPARGTWACNGTRRTPTRATLRRRRCSRRWCRLRRATCAQADALPCSKVLTMRRRLPVRSLRCRGETWLTANDSAALNSG